MPTASSSHVLRHPRTIASVTPRPTSEFPGVEILVRDCITPIVELFQCRVATRVRVVEPLQGVPEFEIEKAEIAAEVSWVRILRVELSRGRKSDAEQVQSRVSGNRRGTTDVIDGFRMQVAAKTLKLTGKEHRVCLINLLRRVPPARPNPANGGVRGLDLV
jgi:hypothetical protein